MAPVSFVYMCVCICESLVCKDCLGMYARSAEEGEKN